MHRKVGEKTNRQQNANNFIQCCFVFEPAYSIRILSWFQVKHTTFSTEMPTSTCNINYRIWVIIRIETNGFNIPFVIVWRSHQLIIVFGGHYKFCFCSIVNFNSSPITLTIWSSVSIWKCENCWKYVGLKVITFPHIHTHTQNCKHTNA